MGTLMRTGETIIGTDAGALRVRTVRRMPEDKRWSKEAVNNIKGTPWAPSGDEEEKPIGVRIDLPGVGGQPDLPPPMQEGPAMATGRSTSSCTELRQDASGVMPFDAERRAPSRTTNAAGKGWRRRWPPLQREPRASRGRRGGAAPTTLKGEARGSSLRRRLGPLCLRPRPRRQPLLMGPLLVPLPRGRMRS